MTTTEVVDDTITLCEKCHNVLIFDTHEEEFFHIGGGKACITLDNGHKKVYHTPSNDHRPWGRNDGSASLG